MSHCLLTLRKLEKSFRGVHALKPLDLELEAGDIWGLVGENGAGKSTLIKLLSGVHQPDGGQIIWNGNTVHFNSPRNALDSGIATIHQELEYFAHLSVAENMLLGERWPRLRWGGVDWRQLHAEARRRLDACELDISAHSDFSQLTAAEKQEVAIATALSRDARLLILDEPTASLTEPEVERLFSHLRRLRSQAVAILYVSHRLDEIFAITNRVAVLRDGDLVGRYETKSVDVDRLIRDMVGRPVEQVHAHTRPKTGGVACLELSGATRAGMFQEISLTVHAGEIVGLAGLVGAGRSELARAIFGLYPIERGSMRLLGQPWKPSSPADSLRAGLVYLPEERKRQGLVLEHSLGESLSIGFSDLISKYGLIDRKQERERVDHSCTAYDIRTSGPQQPVATLSGGNQQKVMLARWLEREPQVIIFDEPTRGVDVGAKAEIHALIDRLAANGNAVLLVSSDLPELVGMSDRILVMNRGRISEELRGDRMNEHDIIVAASELV